MTTDAEREKRLAAEAAAVLVEDGMRVGLGTGSTAAYFVAALAARGLELRCVVTSLATERQAREAGLHVEAFDGTGALAQLDLAVDGADQIAPHRRLVKGGGGAHTREKVVAAAAERFVVIASSDKLVDAIRAPIPLELLAYGLSSTLARLEHARVRDGAPPSPDNGVIADWHGPVDDLEALASRLAAEPGVVEHGFFEPELVSEILVGRGDSVERL